MIHDNDMFVYSSKNLKYKEVNTKIDNKFKIHIQNRLRELFRKFRSQVKKNHVMTSITDENRSS